MPHLLDDLGSVSPRARRFLLDKAERLTYDTADEPDDEALRAMLPAFGLSDDSALHRLRTAQERYSGLQYRSEAWMFGEVIEFGPWASWEVEDGEPIADFVAHSTAHPYSVWMLGDGAIAYCFTGPQDSPVVRVFPHGDALIEADALHHECAGWVEVGGGGAPRVDAVQEAAETSLQKIDEASGFTEWWWDGDGFRVHVLRTEAAVFASARSRWAVWGRDEAGVAAAKRFVRTVVLGWVG